MSQKKSVNESSSGGVSSKNPKVAKKTSFSELSIQKKVNNPNESDFSVITKTTKPKVIIQSENFGNDNVFHCNSNNHKFIKYILKVVMCIIILITFFLSLKTYDMVVNLSK